MIRFAFHKPINGDIWGHLVAAYTRIWNRNSPLYDHVEIGFIIDGKFKWYSSCSRNADGKSGTRWITETELFRHPERWDVYQIKEIRPIESMLNTCQEIIGKPYDWLGIFSFLTIFGQLNNKKKWYCSEACNYIFFGQWKKRISPPGLYCRLIKKGLTKI